MSDFKSALGPSFEQFIRYKKACQRWNDSSYLPNLKLFDAFCYEQYPDEDEVTAEMASSWCAKRETESNNSCISRIYVVLEYIRFINARTGQNIREPLLPKAERRLYRPHAFQQEELKRFFGACDSYTPFHYKTRRELNCKYTLPVLFRLLYSTGMRTVEVRLLERKHVDLENGVINIVNTKGYEQHFVAMHHSMTELMVRYDKSMQRLYPDRRFFFCDDHGDSRKRDWIQYFFRKMWDSVNASPATAYELRHNYAICNINRWLDSGFEFHDKLTYLSKSMGHTTLNNTIKYYYSIVPGMAALIQDKTEAGFNSIIPEVSYEVFE